MKKKLILPMLILSVALGSMTGCSSKEEETQQTEANEGAALNAVEVMALEPDTISKELTYAGKIEANKTVNVTPKVSGRVAEIKVDKGDTVKAGQVLFTLEKDDLQDQVDSLTSQLNVANAGVASAEEALRQAGNGGQTQSARLQLTTAVDTAKKGVEAAEEGVNNAKITLSNTESSYKDVEKKYSDYKQLYDGGVISKSDFDAVELGYTQAKNGLEQAKIGLTTAQNSLERAQLSYNQAKQSLEIYDKNTKSDGTSSAQKAVESAKASRSSVETSLNQVKDKLADTVVTAPCAGIVSSKNIEVTNMVSAGAAPMTITDTSVVTVSVNVSETLINSIKNGDAVKVKVGSASGEERVGKIQSVTGVADQTGTYPVKVEIDNADGSLKPGMFASVSFVAEKKTDTFVVARSTVLENETERYIYLLNDDNSVKKVVVETGIDNGEYIELLTGVKAGDKVVVAGHDYLSDGERVNVVDSSKEEK